MRLLTAATALAVLLCAPATGVAQADAGAPDAGTPPAAARPVPAPPPHPDLPDALRAVTRTKKARFAGAWGGYPLRGAGLVLALSPDGRRAASAGAGGPLRIWDLGTGKQVRVLAAPAGATAAAFAPDGRHVAAGAHDGTITLWDCETGRPARTLRRHQGEVLALAYSAAGKRIASGGEDGTVRVWNLGLGRGLILHGHGDVVRAVAFFPDGNRLASASDDGTVRVWDLATGKAIKVLGVPDGPEALCVAVSPDGARLLVGREGGVARVEVETWEERTLAALPSVLAVSFAPDGTRAIAVASTQREVRLASAKEPVPLRLEIRRWDLESGQALAPLAGPDEGFVAAALSADGARALTGAGGLAVWDLEAGTEERRTGGHTARIQTLVASRDGRQVLSAADDSTARLWEAFSGKELFTFGGHSPVVRAVGFSADGTRAAVGDAMGLLRIFDLSKRTPPIWAGPHRGALSATFTDEDRAVVTTSLERTALWDATTGKEVFSNWFPRVVVAVSVSGDGRFALATDLVDGPAVRENASGRVLRSLRRPDRAARSVLLDRDGSLAAVVTGPVTGAGPDLLELWDAAQGRLLRSARAPAGLRPLAFSDDDRLLLAAAADGSVRLYVALTLKEADRIDLSANGEQPTAAAFAADALGFLVGTSLGAIQQYLLVADPAK